MALAALTATALAAVAASPAQHRPVPPLFGGVQINEPDHDHWVGAVADAGLDSVQVTLYARQQAWDSPELSWDAESPWVVAEIRAAKRRGLRVVLVMRVALEQGLEVNRHLWHGMIWPRADALQAWFDAYRDFLLHGAALAAAEGVDLLAVGNELTSMTSTLPRRELPDLYAYWLSTERVAAVHAELAACADQVQRLGGGADLQQLDGGRYLDLRALLAAEAAARRAWTLEVLGGDPSDLAPLNARRSRYEAAWRRLVAEVRTIYGGPVTYGANFDQVEEVGFWDALDAVGVNAYFPLGRYGERGERRRQRLRQAWEGVAAGLRRPARGRPVVLLELGWTRKAGSTVRPYSYSRVELLESARPADEGLTCVHWATQPEEPEERVAAMRALHDLVVAGGFPELRGFSLWKLTTQRQQRAIEPFAVLLDASGGAGAPQSDPAALDEADARYLALAAAVAATVRKSRWHNGR